jgi:hypothetical protein
MKYIAVHQCNVYINLLVICIGTSIHLHQSQQQCRVDPTHPSCWYQETQDLVTVALNLYLNRIRIQSFK